MTTISLAARTTITCHSKYLYRQSCIHGSRCINIQRCFSSEIPGGADLLQDDQLERRPKIVLDAHASTGFDVSHMIQKVDDEIDEGESGNVHMTGSILAFDRACFLWNSVHSAEDVTYASLSPVLVYRPKLKYLFIGCNTPIPNFPSLKLRLKQQADIVAEQLTIHNAMGTFNILNGEDRSVAAALVLERQPQQDDDEEESFKVTNIVDDSNDEYSTAKLYNN